MNMLGFSDPELIHLVVAIECFEKSQDSSSVTAFGFYGREDRPEALQEIDLWLFKERKTKGDEAGLDREEQQRIAAQVSLEFLILFPIFI